jgi:hypothetical protein
MSHTQNIISSPGIQKVDVTDVLVVGGSSKLQCVEEAVQK